MLSSSPHQFSKPGVGTLLPGLLLLPGVAGFGTRPELGPEGIPPGDFCASRLSSMNSAGCSSLYSEASCTESYEESFGGIRNKQYPCEWDAQNSRCQLRGTYYECNDFCRADRSTLLAYQRCSDLVLGAVISRFSCNDAYQVEKREFPGYEDILFVRCKKNELDPTGRCAESRDEVCHDMLDIIDPNTPEGYCKTLDPSRPDLYKFDLAPTNEWCNTDPARRVNKETCEQHYRTGTNGHVYPCFHDAEAMACRMSGDSIMCCDHLCENLANRKNVNEDAPGFGPWCSSPERDEDVDTCQSAYWTGADFKTYPCVYAKNTGKCRRSLSDACACGVPAPPTAVD